MKKLKAPFLLVVLILFNVFRALASTPGPPPPTARMASTANADATPCTGPSCPPAGVTFPIDQNIIFLVIGGLLLGATVIYKSQNKKASI